MHKPPSTETDWRWAPASGWKRCLGAVAAAAVLAGCQSVPPPSERPLGPEVPPPPQLVNVAPRCDATQARFALGQVVDMKLLEQARDRAGAHQGITARPGEAAAPADPLRLILEVDPQGRMVGARCG
ncbi:hypothetical protein [Variovorax sp.]|uniref:hypothetical protein n=1 Tax=Variovorax sp. TaxID=1871043 RepID=UPI002D2A80D0|nr:hypothetical protein [Variovorax sp.]HYP84308.1 hypothetical protein [Variovorax sp.]